MAEGVLFGDMRMKDITRKDIERAREILLKDGKTPQNINICFAHLNHVFHTAVNDDTIMKNPCKALKQLKRDIPPIGENKHRALTEDETIRFFKAAEERNSYYLNTFLLMAKSGMRVGEVTALYRTDIDRKNGFIHIRRTIARDEAGAYIVGDDAKTKSGQRDIPLTDELYGIIKAQEALNNVIFGMEASGLLFRGAEGQILREYSLNREIKRICAAADIEPFTCHAFRNTFATRFIEQRPQDYKILSEILGHKDVSITLNLYTHVMTENKVRAMNDISVKTS
jgi:integrase